MLSGMQPFSQYERGNMLLCVASCCQGALRICPQDSGTTIAFVCNAPRNFYSVFEARELAAEVACNFDKIWLYKGLLLIKCWLLRSYLHDKELLERSFQQYNEYMI